MERAVQPTRPQDRGQALGLVMISIALIGMVTIGIASLATRLTQLSEAQNAADAAALAGVMGGPTAASAVAARNGGALVSFEDVPSELGIVVTVEVMLGDQRAVARASSDP